jgi:DNA-binding beta-propeller fold protein YncE
MGAEDGDNWDTDGGDYDDGYAEEVEDDFLALEPATTNAFVFVANPSRNTVTRISVPSLAVLTTEVGVDPSVVATTDDYSTAVVFNQGTDDVSIVDSETMEVSTVEVRENFNQMEISPDGKWVVCYHDTAMEDEDDEAEESGALSYSEVSFVNVETLEHFPMVVGTDPHDVQFTDDSQLAVVVSDAYLSVIDLSSDELDSPTRLEISDDLIDPPEAEEVLLAPDGSYAFVRQFGATELVLVDLEALEVTTVATGDNPTDMDITPDGTQAVTVARGSAELWIYDLADPEGEAEVVAFPEDMVFGSVTLSPDDSQGLLYSTATGESLYATWDREAVDQDDAITVRGLVKPVDTIALSPTGGTALIFHDSTNGADVETSSPYYNEFALTLVDLDDFFSNPLLLPGEPSAYSNSEDGEIGFFIMEDEKYLVELDYATLLPNDIDLKSDPVHIGVLPDTRLVYASQDHELGRISFYDPDTEELQTITGFELNSGIEY